MYKKQIVATLEMKSNTPLGIMISRITDKAINKVHKRMALVGRPRFERIPNFFANLFLLPEVREYNILPVVKTALLQEETAAVKTTKLTMAAADLIPIP